MKPLTDLTTGDTVQRNMFGIKQDMQITKVEGHLLHCGPWAFDSRNGHEVDEGISVLVSTITSTTPEG